MRIDAGLEPPERRTGLAAHDFEMALGAEEVLLTAAERIGTSPAERSRFLQRLEGFFGEEIAREMRRRGAEWIALAEAIDIADELEPAPRPAPRPKAGKRPRRLSVTDVEKLIRDPYAIYAKHVLRLRPLDPLGEPPEAALRGTLIHSVLGGFIRDGGDVRAPDALAQLIARADEEFAALGNLSERQQLWLRRFHRMAEEFLVWERGRTGIASRYAEIDGQVDLRVAGETLRLHGRADRVDLRSDGQAEITDFKTGAVPTARQMSDRLAPQLPVEALIARAGGFDDLAAAEAAALTYVKLAHGPDALEVKPFRIKDVALAEAIDDHARLLAAHAELFLLSDAQPMYPHLLPPASARFPGDYDHLARLGEWGGAGEAEE
jgi:ATP-dependent helicase/nuclease subunit B